MISGIVEFLREIIQSAGPIGVFIAGGVEEVIAPIPSAMVLLMSGFFLLSGDFSLLLIGELLLKVVIPATLGITLGSFFVYGIAYYFGQPFLKKWGKYFGLSWEAVEKANQKLSETKKDKLALFAARAIPVIPSVAINAVCGFLRFPIVPYFYLTLLGVSVRAIILGLIGWKVGGLYEYYAEVISVVENAVFIAIIAGLAVFVALHFFRKLFYEIKNNE